MVDLPDWLKRFSLPHPASDQEPEPQSWSFEPAPLPGSGDKREDDVRNGEHAQRLLEDELLRWSLGEMRSRIRDGMETCPIRDTEGMQILRIQFDLLKAFEANLKSLIADGKFAAEKLAQDERRRDIEKRFGRTVV